MKRLQMPENKIARLAINIAFVPVWFVCATLIHMRVGEWLYIHFNALEDLWYITTPAVGNADWVFQPQIVANLLIFVPIGYVTRYIWFKKSRNRIFFGLFDNFKKYQPRIYTTSSNADELKKYAELKDQGIITEEEFQAKKKQILGL